MNFNTVMTVMNRLVEITFRKTDCEKKWHISCCTNKRRILIQSNEENDTGIDGEFGDLVVNHMLDELEQADPTLIKS